MTKAIKNAEALKKHGSKEAKAFDEDNLGLVMGTEREQFLTQIRDSMSADIKNMQKQMDVNKLFLTTLKHEIKKEKEKFK